MSYDVRTTPSFERQAKRIAKKQRSLKNDLAKLFESLSEDPEQGTLLRERTYKIRMAISSKGRGKSGGARVITFLYKYATDEKDGVVALIAIYDKSEMQNISDKEIDDLIADLPEYLE